MPLCKPIVSVNTNLVILNKSIHYSIAVYLLFSYVNVCFIDSHDVQFGVYDVLRKYVRYWEVRVFS